MADSFKDKVVLVTGASSGIGAGCAEEFSHYGCKVALSGRDVSRLQQTSEKCQAAGLPAENIFIVTGDVTEKEACVNIVESAVKHFGKLDILMNVAGATRKRNLANLQVEDLDFCYNILVRSVVMMTQAALPHLEKSKGCVINMSSVSGIMPLPYALPYSMCKCMVDRFTQAASVDMAKKGIRINCINPATVRTDKLKKLFGPVGSRVKDHAYCSWSREVIPLGRVAEIKDVANAAVFLASDAASFITGAMFPLDGAYQHIRALTGSPPHIREEQGPLSPPGYTPGRPIPS